MSERRARYAHLSTGVAYLDDDEVSVMLGDVSATRGWGLHQTVEVAGAKSFVKRIPVTDLELDHRFSTRNLYELPLFYNYGVGSAGFGVWRELLTHVKTTNWVLEEAHDGFPLMYHWRILPRAPSHDETDWDAYVTGWNSSTAIGRYMRDRVDARHEVVIFLEHIPYEMGTWLGQNQDAAEDVVRQLVATIDFLRANRVVHFDAHFSNVITDGSTVYLADYGLVLDDAFQLTDEERAFRERHDHYDYGEALMSLAYALAGPYLAVTIHLLGEADRLFRALGGRSSVGLGRVG